MNRNFLIGIVSLIGIVVVGAYTIYAIRFRPPTEEEIVEQISEVSLLLGPVENADNDNPLDDRITVNQFVVSSIVERTIPLNKFLNYEVPFKVGDAELQYPATVLITGYLPLSKIPEADITIQDDFTIVVVLPPIEIDSKLDTKLSDPPSIEKSLNPWISLILDLATMRIGTAFEELLSVHAIPDEVTTGLGIGVDHLKGNVFEMLILGQSDFDQVELQVLKDEAEQLSVQQMCDQQFNEKFTYPYIENFLEDIINNQPQFRRNVHQIDIQIMPPQICSALQDFAAADQLIVANQPVEQAVEEPQDEEVEAPPPQVINVPVPTATVTVSTDSEFILVNSIDLQQQMHDLINEARAAEELAQLDWDMTATLAATLHAQDMVQHTYFSHWNQEGLGPEHRYMFVDGQHTVMENIHALSYTYDDGRPAPIENWQEVIQNAHNGLMNSPGHYANIMDPAHTHVGIGMAYNPETGQFRLVQMFTNQYVQLVQPIPAEMALGSVVVVNGRISSSDVTNILLNLAYEPFPTPMTREELDATSTYASRAESLKTVAVSSEFNEHITINGVGEPGFYHIRIFGDLPTGQALLMERIITVR